MKYCIGIDLGTSAVKALLVDEKGMVAAQTQREYPLMHPQPGYSEQDPEQWVEQTVAALKEIVQKTDVEPAAIEGISFSGQMHGLVLLDEHDQVIRPSILWNDTRTTDECREIEEVLKDDLLDITKNRALEGFTLPKLLWVKKHEPEAFKRVKVFLLPKDYVRFRLTGRIHSEYSDAAGTLLLDVPNRQWSSNICNAFDIHTDICPELVESTDSVGELLPEVALFTGLSQHTKVFAGGADNACSAIGSGITSSNKALSSIGTSGVFLMTEKYGSQSYHNNVHFFNHAIKGQFYSMGVTLAAGYSLTWLKKLIAPDVSFSTFFEGVADVPPGANGLLFTPYLVGERTPHADATIRGSFIGVSGNHASKHFVRAVMEGIVFSLNETMQMYNDRGQNIQQIVSVGGGAKNEAWLQIQADIYGKPVVKLANEQGPSLGAAMIAAVGLGWFADFDDCADTFVKQSVIVDPIVENNRRYKQLFGIYRQVYENTEELNKQLSDFR